MNNNTITKVIFLGTVAILSILAVQSYWVLRTYNIQENEFNQKVVIALTNVAQNLAEFNQSELPSGELIDQQASNYYVVNINDFIKQGELEFFLKRELQEVALNEDFEYGVYDCSSNAVVYGDYISYSPDSKVEVVPALPKAESDFDYYFSVRFPKRQAHILTNMLLPLIFTGILLLAVAFFVYSITVILKQRRLSEMQKDFINNMTHEFKTPISTVNISANVLSKHPSILADERLTKYTNIIQQQNDRLNHQVEKVLQLAKIEKDNFKLSKEKVELNEALHVVAQSTGVKVTSVGGKIDLDMCDQPLCIQADHVHLNNILHNLMDNAIKYCGDEPPTLHIITMKDATNKEAIVTIKDEGIGIAKQHLHRIFKKFYRVPTGNVHNVKGFGLGLFYVKNVCKSHGWNLQVDSKLNKGTTFTIRIPLVDC